MSNRQSFSRHAKPFIEGRSSIKRLGEEDSLLNRQSGRLSGNRHQSHDDVELPPLHKQIIGVLTSMKLNVLLLFIIPSFLSYYLEWPHWLTFGSSFFALIPLAAMMGTFTEELALHFNETVGAFLNVTFGNATELIVSVVALWKGLCVVIQNTLMGSVLGNMLLVLGTSIIAAGLRKKKGGHVTFNSRAVNIYSGLLLLAVTGLIIPTAFRSNLVGATDDQTLKLSRTISIMMIISYFTYLVFQLYTHKGLFEEDAYAPEDEDEEEEAPTMHMWVALIGLILVTVVVGFESEFLVDSLVPTAERFDVSPHFLSVILVPIVGNVAEHSTAVIMAFKGKMDIAVGVAVGSSLQISMFLIPVMVIISWVKGTPFTLDFHPFSTIMVMVSVIITTIITFNGKVHWLEGFMLLMAYFMIGSAFIFAPQGEDTQC